MTKLAVILLFVVIVGCAMATRPRPTCRTHLGEKLKGPGRVCETKCAQSKWQGPQEKCLKTKRAKCMCSRKAGYCRNTATGKCNKLKHRD